MEDDTVETLLRNLLGQARNLAQTERQRWRWRCFLVHRGESWSIEQQLELPSIVTGASLQAWSDWSDLSARLRVLLQTMAGIDIIALLTRLQGTGDQAVYRCERLRRSGVRLRGSAAVVGARLLLCQGNEEIDLPMVGGQELGPLPWVFVERGSQWEMCGEGSVKRREPSVRVLALNEGSYTAAEGACEPFGTAACAGRVWMRYRDANGALRFRRQVEVVPTTTRVEMVRGGANAEEAGIIRLSGLPAVRVVLPKVAGCQFGVRMVDDSVEIDCFAPASLPVTHFSADFQWPDDRSLTVTLPFPRQGAAFVRAGQMLPPMERVALGRLAAIQAVVRTPTGGGRFHLEGKLRTSASVYGKQELRESLLTATNEPIQFALHRLQERLASMLAMTGDLDASIILEIVDWEGHALAQLEVAQFDVALEPDRPHNRAVLQPASLGRLNDDWEEHITVKMLPLWEPSTTATDLVRDDAAMAWKVPDELEPGPWWVLGYDGDWARFRPLSRIYPASTCRQKSVTGLTAVCQAISERSTDEQSFPPDRIGFEVGVL